MAYNNSNNNYSTYINSNGKNYYKNKYNNNSNNNFRNNNNGNKNNKYQKTPEQLSYEQSLRNFGVTPNSDMTARQRFERVKSMITELGWDAENISILCKTWWDKI